jgi:hypothetical protein
MRYAIIKDGIVENVVVSSAAYAEMQGWVYTEFASPGWLYDEETKEFSPPPEVDDEQA